MNSPAYPLPMLPYSGSVPINGIMIPDLLLDTAVREYSDWWLSQVDSQIL